MQTQIKKTKTAMRIFETLVMVIALAIAIAATLLVASAHAGVTCQTTEDGYTYCWDSSTKESTSCQTTEDGYTYCN